MSLETTYRANRSRILEPLAIRLEAFLRDCCKDLPRIDRISARAKSVDRFLAKAAKQTSDGTLKYEDPLRQIQDQIGARIVTFYLSDVHRAIEHVCPYFRAVEQQSIIPEPDEAFGYVGRHFILFIPSDLLDEDVSADAPRFFELQIKTLFQHAWSEANHDMAYKPPVPMSKDQKRFVAFTAAQAWGADQIFDRLSKELLEGTAPA